MQLAAILNQYHDVFQATAPGFYPAIYAPLMRSAAVGHRKPDSCLFNAAAAVIPNGGPVHAGIAAARNVRIMTRRSGWIVNRKSFCRSITSWQPLRFPMSLRFLAWDHQTLVYNLLFACASSTLKDFGINPKNLGADIGLTAVLHTHNRRLEYHPHVHVVVPGGGVDKTKKQWKKKKSKYLFNEFALVKVFRARFLAALANAGLDVPDSVPKKWVVDCTRAGKGMSALKYLSRYLYRGVIGESNIVYDQDGKVTFKYAESCTGKTCYRTLKGEDFLWLVLQHVLPKGFRGIRDYGFLHGNAKRLLHLVQLILQVLIQVVSRQPRPFFKCPLCQAPMHILGIGRQPRSSG